MVNSPTDKLSIKMDRMITFMEGVSKSMCEQEEILQEQDRVIAYLQSEKNTENRNKKMRSNIEQIVADFSHSSFQHVYY